LRVQNVVLAAGVLGTVQLLLEGKRRGDLPALSDQVGCRVRSNGESILAVRCRGDVDHSRGLAASTSVFPDEHTQIQADRYPAGSDALALLSTVLVEGSGLWRWLATIFRHPLDFLRTLWPRGFAKQSAILVVMQDLASSVRLSLVRSLGRRRLEAVSDSAIDAPPASAPIGRDFARRLAHRVNGIPLSSLSEVLLAAPATAHILGGAVIGTNPEGGVVDAQQRAFGYRGLYVCDGSVVPSNLGVNPALTILALAERAMAHVPAKGPMRSLSVDREWGVEQLLQR
jgi:cholesterol oxidase